MVNNTDAGAMIGTLGGQYAPYDRAYTPNRAPGAIPTGTPTPEPAIEPYVKPAYKTPAPLESVNNPTLQDFIGEAQKLSDQNFKAKAAQLGEETGDIADEFARRLYSQNVGGTSGVGLELTNRAIQDQAKRLEPYGLQQAAELGEKELGYKREDYLTDKQQTQTKRDNMFNQILAGTVDRSQMSTEDWAAVGITDPEAIKTLAEVDFANAMVADGLDPNNPEHQAQYSKDLKNAKMAQLRQQIVANFAAVNDGQMPTPDEVEMIMYIYGSGTGVLSPAQETELINKYNDEQWARTMKKAEAMNPPDEGTVLCTVLHDHGKLPDDVFESDMLVGHYYKLFNPEVLKGYHRWGVPLANLMRKSRLVEWLLTPFIKAWAYQMHGKKSFLGNLLFKVGVPICKYLGRQRRVLAW